MSTARQARDGPNQNGAGQQHNQTSIKEPPPSPATPSRSLKRTANFKSRLNHINVKHETQVKLRTRQLTLCLCLFVGATSSLAPFLKLHLTNRVGLLLFESDLLQLRSSLITVIICLLFLVILGSIILLLSRHSNSQRAQEEDSAREPVRSLFGWSVSLKPLESGKRRKTLLLQKLLKLCAVLLAIISVFSYLSLALLVPHIHQIQRMPYATFDCNANLITIENCQQQFATLNDGDSSSNNKIGDGGSSMLETLGQLIWGDLNGNNGQLSKRLQCLKYNDESFEKLRVPTRFLLSKCGLVCEPQRQQLHQFSDDLNAEQFASLPVGLTERQLVAPYSQLDYHNDTSNPIEQPEADLVTLKLCFSGEINGGTGSSNYKRFCIENLMSGGGSPIERNSRSYNSHNSASYSQTEHTLTVGQLNAILSRVRAEHDSKQTSFANSQSNTFSGRVADQSTHYVNPIVQFESHFKNWPRLTASSTQQQQEDQQSSYFSDRFESAPNDSKRSKWCKFKPIPPFIVNNKPFSDIHCSLEHDYLLTTGPRRGTLSTSFRQHSSRRRRRRATPRIYLKKSTSLASPLLGLDHLSEEALSHNERCNIQCKVNILYQVHVSSSGGLNIQKRPKSRFMGGGELNSAHDSTTQINSYYMPLKFCLIVSGNGDKTHTSNYYLLFRSIADATLLLTFILIDILLLIESMDTKQFQLEGKKVRLFSLLLAITLVPLVVAALFDLAASWMPTYQTASSSRNFREGYLIQMMNERLIPLVSELLERWIGPSSKSSLSSSQDPSSTKPIMNNSTADTSAGSSRFSATATNVKNQHELVVDNYLVPFLIYALLMFAFAINAFKLPLVSSTAPLSRATSTEELGMVASSRDNLTPPKKRSRVMTKSLVDLKKPELANANNSKCLEAKMSSLKNSIASSSSHLAQDEKNGEFDKQTTTQRKVIFAMLTLFMGLQFNLSQVTQTHILLESFSIQNDLAQQQQFQHHARPNKVALWFVLVTNASVTLPILLLALLFSDELSLFLNEFFPFKTVPKRSDQGRLGRHQNQVRFTKYLSISLLVYSLRYFVLANIISTQSARLKWFLLVLIQSFQFVNFPLVWFMLTSRAHELLVEQQQQQYRDQGQDQNKMMTRQEAAETTEEQSSKFLNLHLLVQASLAFVFFALARFLALFVHSLHASLYLHSDNVDWFIETFYDMKSAQATKQTSSNKTDGTATSESNAAPESLFLPLPSERQTYLYASRFFIKYNSLICFMFGLFLSGMFAVQRYQLWLEQKRLDRLMFKLRSRTPQSDRESDLVDERLSLDLIQIRHQSQPDLRSRQGSLGPMMANSWDSTANFTQHLPRRTRTTNSRQVADSSTADEDEQANQRPRARIHFGYDLGLGKGARRGHSSGSSSSCSSSSPTAAFRRNRGKSSQQRATQSARNESRLIPVIMEEDLQEQQQQTQTGSRRTTTTTECMTQTRTRSKSIRIVTDDENWSLGDEDKAVLNEDVSEQQTIRPNDISMATSPPPPGFGDELEEVRHSELEASMSPPAEFCDDHDQDQTREPAFDQQQTRVVKRLTFAPTATFIDDMGGHWRGRRVHEQSTNDSPTNNNIERTRRSHGTRLVASPEPSIDDEEGDEYGIGQNNFYRRHFDDRP